jgi:hypothetical protein
VLDDETLQGLNLDENKEDSSRRTGDLTVYQYYFENIGWPLLSLFLFCCILFVLGLSFPRQYISLVDDLFAADVYSRDMVTVVDSC